MAKTALLPFLDILKYIIVLTTPPSKEQDLPCLTHLTDHEAAGLPHHAGPRTKHQAVTREETFQSARQILLEFDSLTRLHRKLQGDHKQVQGILIKSGRDSEHVNSSLFTV